MVVSKILNKYEMLRDGNQGQIDTHLNDKPVQASRLHGLYDSDNLSAARCGWVCGDDLCIWPGIR